MPYMPTSSELSKVLKNLGANNIDYLLDMIEYFSNIECNRRDSIVLNYLGVSGVRNIIDDLSREIRSIKPLKNILEIGVDTGSLLRN
jgi:hypothetical protein